MKLKKANARVLFAAGTKHNSNNYGPYTVVKFESHAKVLVRFDDTENEVYATAGNLSLGSVKDKMKPLVYGKGFLGNGEAKASEKGKLTKSYLSWVAMLSGIFYEGNPFKTNKGKPISEEWLNFQNFDKWFQENTSGDNVKVRLKEGKNTFSPKNCELSKPGKNPFNNK